MSDFLGAVVAFIVVLGPLVLIHEFGHFIAARMIGVTVLEFGLGFPPRAVKLFEQQGTEFTLNWLPIGGFVRPLGEDFVKPVGPEATEKDRKAYEKYQQEMAALGKKFPKTKSLMEAGPWQRMWFMSAGALFNFVAAFILLAITSLIGKPGPAVVVLANIPNSPAAVAGLQPEDVVLAVDGRAVTTVDESKRFLRVVNKEAPAVTLTVRRGGETFDLKIPASAPACDTTPADPDNPGSVKPCGQGIYVLGTATQSPAAEVLKPGDVIWEADGQAVSDVDVFREQVKVKAGTEMTFTVLRNLESVSVKLTPRKDPPAGQGALGVSIVPLSYDAAYGISLAEANAGPVVREDLGTSIRLAAEQTGMMFRTILEAPVRILRQEIQGDDARIVSPIGIAQISSEVINASSNDQTPYRILQFIATISIALGITNLFPIPGLDGGRILFVIVELVRGKPINPEAEGWIHTIGIMLLLGLVAIIAINDIVNPIGPLLGR